MVINLRPPSGPGLPQPELDEPWKRTSFFNEPNLRKILDSPYHQDTIDQAIGPRAFGTIGGGPSLGQAYDILHPDPRKWSTIEAPRSLAAPMLADFGAKPTNDNARKTGQFNLNLIRPFDSLQAAVTTGVGRDDTGFQEGTFDVGGTPGLGALANEVFGRTKVSPTDILNWSAELPVRLMERPLTLLQTLSNRLLGTPLAVDDDGDAAYPFQKDPSYWAWLRGATDEQLSQFARAQAGQYASAGRNGALYDTLVDRFRQDKNQISGLSSGSLEIDYGAKRRAWNASGQPGALNFGGDRDWTQNPIGTVAGQILGAVPFIGINLVDAINPIEPEIEAYWQSLGPAQRQEMLQQQGYTIVAQNLIGMPFGFSGVTALAGAAKASSIPTIANLGKVWSKTLEATNILMASGLTISTAAWAAETYLPQPLAEFGRDVNMGAPLAHSVLGAVLNNVGMFASGSYGAALALRAGARIPAAVGRGSSMIESVWGTRELPFYSEGFGGSAYRSVLHEVVPDMPAGMADLAVKKSLMSYLEKASDGDRMAVYEALEQRLATVPELDALPVADREAWISAELGRSYSSRGARVAQMMDRLDRYRQSLPLLPSTNQRAAHAATQLGVRNLVDSATHAIVTQYGPKFFGATLADIRGRVESGLREMGRSPDMAKMDRRLGTKDNPATVGAWLKMARLVHQMGYISRNGELHEAIKSHPGSTEAGLALFSQRTPFADEMAAALPVLRGEAGAARALARKLIGEKLRLDELYALGEFRDRTATTADPDPIRLAEHIQDSLEQEGFPARRINAGPGDPTADLPLNAFHTKIAGEGKWELGFREAKPFSRGETLDAYLQQELTPFQFAMLEPQRVTIIDVPPAGYVELKPGQRFTRTNWYELKVTQTHDGKLWALDDGSLGSGTPAPIAPMARTTNNPDSPQPFDPYVSTKAAEAFDSLPERQQVLVREVDRAGGTFAKAPAEYDLEPTGDVMRGRNAGAEWPVLEHSITGDKYLFKARRGDVDLADLSPARRLAGPTATKLFAYFGLHTAEEIPFAYGGVKGTLQQLVDVSETMNLRKPENYTAEVRAELVKHHVVDWLTGQHDSNSDSFLIGNDGHVYGIDKGQAYKYMADPEPAAALTNGHAFWDFRTPDALDTHLGEYLGQAIAEGRLEMRWSDVEPLIREIEALPEDIYLRALQPLAEARVKDGRFEGTVEEFYAAALERKRSMRSAVKGAYQFFDYATLPGGDALPFWVPGRKGLVDLDTGNVAHLNERPIPIEELYARNDANPVPEPDPPATADHYKAGVVIREPDGRLWAMAPKGYDGYTWPKGKVDGTESFQHAAIREAFEETGLSVVLEGHLADLPNEAGNVTRYYVGRRVSGGPEHIGTPDEVGGVALMKEGEAGSLLFSNQRPDVRDNAVLDALREYRVSENQARQTLTDEPEAGPTGSEAVTLAEPAAEMGYVSHVRLKNGSVWETPWLDPEVLDVGAINLGNRGIAGRAFDGAFHGWRAWRIAETQKLGLHHKLTRDYPITPGQVEEFHTSLLALSRKYRGASIQSMAGTWDLQVLGKMGEDVAAAAAKVFGEGPFLNRRTGRADVIDFRRETVKAYRQSARLNLLAGLTSNIKAMPGIGGLILPVTDVIYPLFRYALSFIFKPSEIMESAALNAMRGVVRSGDPFIDALYYRTGLDSNYGLLAQERMYDMQLQSITTFSPTLNAEQALSTAASPGLGQRSKFGQDPFFYERLDPKALAKRIAAEVAPREAAGPATGPPRSTLADSLEGGGLELADPVRYPDLYPDRVRHLLEQVGVDEAGNAILEQSGGDKTRRQVQTKREQILGELLTATLDDPEAAVRIGAGFAVLRSLPAGTIERLAEAMPIMHTPVTRQSHVALDRQLGFIAEAIEAGNPMLPGTLSTGKYELALYETLTGGTVGAAEKTSHGVSGTTISGEEQWMGFADAKYGGMAAYDNPEGMLVMLKPEALRESVTLDTDRIRYTNDVQAIRDSMMTPAAVNAITRLTVQRMIVEWAGSHSELTFGEFVNQRGSTYFGAIEPFEFAFMDGIKADDVAGLLLPAKGIDKWTKLVQDHAEHPNAGNLADVPIVPFDENVGYTQSMWANVLERAGLLDLMKSKPEDFGLPTAEEGILSLPMEAMRGALDNPVRASWLATRIASSAREAGLSGEVHYSHADHVQIAINAERLRLRGKEGRLEKLAKTPTKESGYYETPDVARGDIAVASAKLAELETLQRDLAEFNRTGGYASHEEAAAAVSSTDPTVAARASNWLQSEGALSARMGALGILERGEGPVQGTVRVVNTKTGEVVLDRPSEPGELELTGGKHGQVNHETLPWDVDRARALLDAHQRLAPAGYGVQAEGFLPHGTTYAISSSISSPAFRASLRARAEAKLGVGLEDPVIRTYARGPAHRIADLYPQTRGVDELIVTVQDGSGRPYGNLTLPEIAELWQQYGLPATFKERAAAAQFDAKAAGRLEAGDGSTAGYLMHGEGPTPEGRAYVYQDPGTSIVNGTWEQSPLGKRYVDTEAPVTFDISFNHHFEPGGKSYVDLETGTALWRSSIDVEVLRNGAEVGGEITQVTKRGRRIDDRAWRYEVKRGADGIREATITDVDRWAERTSESQLKMQVIRDLAGRADEYATEGVRLKLTDGEDRIAFDRLALRGEIPEWLVAVDNMGAVVDKPAMVRELNPGAREIPMEPPPATFTELEPSGRFSDRVQAELELLGVKGKAAARALFVDPIPYKQRAMDKLGFKLIRDRFAPLLREEAPEVAAVFSELKVPEGRWMDFVLYDRHLLDRWLKSGARADWEGLIEHSGQYTGKADYKANRQSLDELYTSPGFDTMLETLRLTMKAAQDEAYQVHFFTPYRSAFERSINHPLLGVYPASWAYKVAKEWIRFLYQNETLGFRAGMVPAQIIRQISDAQAVAFAQTSDTSLEEFYEKGPYRNSIFIFNLLMPGDWSSLPFPASRTIRDTLRGNANLNDIFANNISSIGMGRDIRLASGAGDELLKTITGDIGKGRAFNAAGVSNQPGWSLAGDVDVPAQAPVTPPREIYQWR